MSSFLSMIFLSINKSIFLLIRLSYFSLIKLNLLGVLIYNIYIYIYIYIIYLNQCFIAFELINYTIS